jgi:peptide/nickel transport system substrate-binding protein
VLAAPQGAPSAGDGFLARATSAPLLEADGSGRLAPGLLAEVPAPEAGGRAFRLRLRPGLSDAAGRPLGADAVAARLAGLLAPGEEAWTALPILGADAVLDGRAEVLAGVQVLSPAELLVTLAFPLPEFPWLLAAVALPGAGPFVAGERDREGGLVLRANPHHHLGRPFADAIVVRETDARGAARQLGRGGLDLVLRPEAAGGRPGPPLPPLTATVAALRAERLGAAADAVRRALSALDRGELSRRFVRGPAQPLATLLPPAVLPAGTAPGATAPAATPPARAAARLALLVDGSAPEQRALAERIQVKLFDAGIRATIELAGRGPFAERLARGDYDVALVPVRVTALRPALAAGQIVSAARGPAAGRRAMAELAGLADGEAAAAADRLAREHDLVPLVASGLRLSLAPGVEGARPGADGALDAGALWRLRSPGVAR